MQVKDLFFGGMRAQIFVGTKKSLCLELCTSKYFYVNSSSAPASGEVFLHARLNIVFI